MAARHTRSLRTRKGRALAATIAGTAAVTLAACGGGGGFDDDGGGATDGGDGSAGGPITMLIGSSGDAETDAMTDALARFTEETGIVANLRLATDLNQQLAQGFAAGSPPDMFYVSTEGFPGWAANGSLYPYGDQLDADFYPALQESFTFDGQFFCAPKDFSTLALIINDSAWADAGLTEDDYPTTWDELTTVAQTLTTDTQAGLTFGPEWQRIGVFMNQAGGHLLDDAGSADVDTPENLEGLQFAKDLLTSGVASFPSAIDSGWGGEAFGSQRAAMTIEGNWIGGAMSNDFPDVEYTVVELPEGPGGKGTLQFTNCLGIAADSQQKEAAVELAKFLTTDETQMELARGFGVMPSVTTVADQWAEEFPEQQAFVAGGAYASGVPAIEGWTDVVGDFNAQIEGLTTGDPQAILRSVQSTFAAIAP
ncbi:extracellular solute-binding protein family 1 [Xylanimonas cellulosilytica DSM 15894]|uniref:Extracellular solute-binding protein family 1 n=1 Tax=Xylanimonas cellulosilytica (strain DSM 15894 / JCM 12276 / CECT 5975 / KCTC 9989 / LMG 20990 / NBRC 107835 / XIL07) TaxID=446471 RepID=D1BZL5_XYLCX|nr:extracellular solute-binding protein [Xylanimonas cellulosilytica]ACZ30169.1 extracellular solute-binding protein family 1 [Xylanimonas cellulosilytica DSM 15894]